MNRVQASIPDFLPDFGTVVDPAAHAYLADTTIPLGGGCPKWTAGIFSLAHPLNRQWSTSLPSSPRGARTGASAGSARSSPKSSQPSRTSFGVWFGVSGTTFNATSYPGLLAPLVACRLCQSLHRRPGKQRRWAQHHLLQPVERRLHQRGAGLHARDHRQCARRYGGIGRPAAIRRPDSRCRHALPQRRPGHVRHARRARHCREARARTTWSPCSPTNWATGSASTIPPSGGHHVSLCPAARPISGRSPHRSGSRRPSRRRRSHRHPLALSRSQRHTQRRANPRAGSCPPIRLPSRSPHPRLPELP